MTQYEHFAKVLVARETEELKARNEKLKAWCSRAADALEQLHLVNVNREPECAYCQFIAELRKAAV
jgi:hypothetical protein